MDGNREEYLLTAQQARLEYKAANIGSHSSPIVLQLALLFLLLLSLFYNPILAAININVTPLTGTIVMIAEAAIVAGFISLFVFYYSYLPNQLTLPILFLFGFSLIFLWVCFWNNQFFIKSFRDMLLIFIFFIVGGLITKKTIIRLFYISTILVFAFMLLEMLSVETYVALFNPESYYVNTRGAKEALYGEVDGLFGGAYGFEGRFSFGIFDTHRISSLFLEQLSIANYAQLLAIFVSCFWKQIPRHHRLLHCITVILILLTNNSRTATGFVAFLLLTAPFYSKMPRFSQALYMPCFFIISVILFYDPNLTTMVDTLNGRYGYSLYELYQLTPSDLFLGDLIHSPKIVDSGITVLIMQHTIIGALLFFLFAAFAPPSITTAEKRLAHGINLFIVIGIMVGSSQFSIKCAALLWLLVGYSYYARKRGEPLS